MERAPREEAKRSVPVGLVVVTILYVLAASGTLGLVFLALSPEQRLLGMSLIVAATGVFGLAALVLWRRVRKGSSAQS